MKSRSKIERQLKRKTNMEIVRTIVSSKKNKTWFEIAHVLSSPARKRIVLNIEEIDREIKSGERVVIPGKVLSQGEITKKAEIIAIGFSEKAKEKLLKAGCKTSNLLEEIKKNPEAKNIKILKK